MDPLSTALETLGIDEVALGVQWPCALKTDAAQERALIKALAPWTTARPMQRLAWDLPEGVRTRIGDLAKNHGFTSKQAFSLRRAMLKCSMGMRAFMALGESSNEKANMIGEAFEIVVEKHLRTILPASVELTTEAQRKSQAAASGLPSGPTPDFTFEPAIRINGRAVHWLDAKMLYASAHFTNKVFMPESRFRETAQKYNAAFGSGALVIAGGFCAALEERVPALLLDASSLDMQRIHAAIESDQTTTPLTADAMRTALGLPSQQQHRPVLPRQQLGLPGATEHVWDPVIRQNASISYHLCTRCGAMGIRRKVTNKLSGIFPQTEVCNPVQGA